MTILREIELLTWFNGIEKLKSILKRLLAGNTFTDAPSDGKIYARQDGAWVEVISGGGFATFQQIWDANPSNTTITDGTKTVSLTPASISMDSGVGQQTTIDTEAIMVVDSIAGYMTNMASNEVFAQRLADGTYVRLSGENQSLEFFNGNLDTTATIKADNVTDNREYQVPDETGIIQLQP